MGRAIIDITGRTYHSLKVVGYSHTDDKRKTYWKCECLLCGNVVTVRKDNFAYPYSEKHSCGCDNTEKKRQYAYQRKDAETGRFSSEQKRKVG